MRKQANRDISSDSKVTVSIVLPVYNGEHFLHQSVDSIIKQSFKNYELIIVDDCSTDNSLKIAESFAAKDKRISVIHNKVNQKLPESLNIGFAKARGKYLTWTSDDNIAKPDWLKTMVEYLDKNSSVDMVVGTMDLINERDEFISATVKKNNVRSLTYRNNVGAVFMYRKSIADQIGKYDIGSFGVEDWDYWCRIALNGTIGYIPDNLYSYRIHDNSLSSLYREDILKKMAFIQDKYSDKLVDRFNLNWWNKTKVKYLRTNTLPYIGKITANHLARNLGENVVKYDIWIQRLGVLYSRNSALYEKIDNGKLNNEIKKVCDDMFTHLESETNLPRGYIDVVLWKSAQNHLIKDL